MVRKIYKKFILSNWYPGMIVLTSFPGTSLNGIIRHMQFMGMGGKFPVKYGHIAITLEEVGKIAESVLKITVGNDICRYHNANVKIILHRQMTNENFRVGVKELLDNAGQPYPIHRLLIRGFDMTGFWLARTLSFGLWSPIRGLSNLLPLDWPVCSAYAAQMLLTADLETGIALIDEHKDWRGVNPHHYDVASKTRPDLWLTLAEGLLQCKT